MHLRSILFVTDLVLPGPLPPGSVLFILNLLWTKCLHPLFSGQLCCMSLGGSSVPEPDLQALQAMEGERWVWLLR